MLNRNRGVSLNSIKLKKSCIHIDYNADAPLASDRSKVLLLRVSYDKVKDGLAAQISPRLWRWAEPGQGLCKQEQGRGFTPGIPTEQIRKACSVRGYRIWLVSLLRWTSFWGPLSIAHRSWQKGLGRPRLPERHSAQSHDRWAEKRRSVERSCIDWCSTCHLIRSKSWSYH